MVGKYLTGSPPAIVASCLRFTYQRLRPTQSSLSFWMHHPQPTHTHTLLLLCKVVPYGWLETLERKWWSWPTRHLLTSETTDRRQRLQMTTITDRNKKAELCFGPKSSNREQKVSLKVVKESNPLWAAVKDYYDYCYCWFNGGNFERNRWRTEKDWIRQNMDRNDITSRNWSKK